MSGKQMAGTYDYIVYVLNGITYLPDYKSTMFVGPGYTCYAGLDDGSGNRFYTTDSDKLYTASFLESKGAKKSTASLWARFAHKALR